MIKCQLLNRWVFNFSYGSTEVTHLTIGHDRHGVEGGPGGLD
jgi:hypothetical protein